MLIVETNKTSYVDMQLFLLEHALRSQCAKIDLQEAQKYLRIFSLASYTRVRI